MPCDHCPIGDGCKSYPTLCENLAKNPKRWLPVVERVNEPPRDAPRSTPIGYAIESAVDLVASGFRASGENEAERRHAICRSCPHSLYDASRDKCLECSCTMRIKVRGLKMRCPRKAW